MPNWCSNTLHIIGPKKAVDSFRRAAKGVTAKYNNFHGESWDAFDETRIKIIAAITPGPGRVQDLSFHALYPVPEDVRRFGYDSVQAAKVKAITGHSEALLAGYNWETTHWGVKWGASDIVLTIQDSIEAYNGMSMTTYEFQTPWGPPDAFLNKVSKDFPELNFNLLYSEAGMAFEGKMEWEDGEQTLSESWEYEDEEEWEDE